MYTLKSIAQRGTLFGAVAALVLAAVLPATAAFADSLNPLTKRSLLLTSSAPGFMDTDGSGNSENNPNAWTGPEGNYYALPGSGPNGKKTGETFTFNVSTDSSATGTNAPVKAITLQYCTTAAGKCRAPGDNTTAGGGADTTSTSDLNINFATTTAGAGQGVAAGEFQVTSGGTATATDWGLAATTKEDSTYVETRAGLPNNTGKKNFISLTSPTGISPVFDETVQVKFTASSTNYITNPGSGSFFVKINTYSDEAATTVIDGGVTVANVMTDSIHITTKVLETMSFSVGVQNPDTQSTQHGSCDPITVIANNRLDLGDPNAESSLSTQQAYDTNSYWRLSSNSSGGATVYYSGDTLRNTVGDSIKDMALAGAPDRKHSQPGTEQFGLALVDAGRDAMDASTWTAADETADPLHVEGTQKYAFPINWVTPNISPLVVQTPYAGGGYGPTAGDPLLPISNGVGTGNGVTSDNAEFAFSQTSKTIPEVIARNSDQVISCATAKVRYVGNIAADTPAGVYTTKINYLAAPQY